MYVPGSSGTVRLVGGQIPEEGNVEVCVNRMWSSVCYHQWDYKDAFVVCRQLGYPATGEDDGVNFSFPSGFDLEHLIFSMHDGSELCCLKRSF